MSRPAALENFNAPPSDIPGLALSNYVYGAMPARYFSQTMKDRALPATLDLSSSIYPDEAATQLSALTPEQLKPILDKAKSINLTTSAEDKKSELQPDFFLSQDGKLTPNPAKVEPSNDGSVTIELQSQNTSEVDSKKVVDAAQLSAINDLFDYITKNNPGITLPKDWMDLLRKQLADLPPAGSNDSSSGGGSGGGSGSVSGNSSGSDGSGGGGDSGNSGGSSDGGGGDSGSGASSSSGGSSGSGGDSSSGGGGGSSSGSSTWGDGGGSGNSGETASQGSGVSGQTDTGGGDGDSGGDPVGTDEYGRDDPNNPGALVGDARAAAANNYDGNESNLNAAQVAIANVAEQDSGKEMWHGFADASAEEGCAASVSNVLDQIQAANLHNPNDDNCGSLDNHLRAQGWTPTDKPQPGDVVIGYGGTSPGHTGIVGRDGAVYDNHSSNGVWSKDKVSYFTENWDKVVFLKPPATTQTAANPTSSKTETTAAAPTNTAASNHKS